MPFSLAGRRSCLCQQGRAEHLPLLWALCRATAQQWGPLLGILCRHPLAFSALPCPRRVAGCNTAHPLRLQVAQPRPLSVQQPACRPWQQAAALAAPPLQPAAYWPLQGPSALLGQQAAALQQAAAQQQAAALPQWSARSAWSAWSAWSAAEHAWQWAPQPQAPLWQQVLQKRALWTASCRAALQALPVQALQLQAAAACNMQHSGTPVEAGEPRSGEDR